MSVQPYLFFEGRCEEALEFYKKTLGAKVDMLMRYKDAPPGAEPKAEQCGGVVPPADKVMHAAFRIGDAVVMASDGMVSGKSEFKGFSLSVDVADKGEDPFQPAWYYKTTNGTYIARIFRYVVEGD